MEDGAKSYARSLYAAILVATRGWETMSERATFGAELRRLRLAAGLSLNELAQRVHYSKGYLSKVETGMAGANIALARLCDAEFKTGDTLVTLVPGEKGRRRVRQSAAFSRPSALPAMTPHFTGRGGEIEEIRGVLADRSGTGLAVCAVDGMAGAGKTTLAVRCAHRLQAAFADGCLFLDLRGYSPQRTPTSPAEALDRLLRALGVPGDEIPADVDDRAAVYRSRLTGSSFLIVLDNAHSASQVVPLLPSESKCRVLITSRHRLAALDDAHHVSLGTLPRDDAADLFHTLLPGHEPEVDELVASIIERCGRLPLAIRIAAARLRANPVWHLFDLDSRLADEASRLVELDDGERSIAAAFALSFNDLPEDQRRMFCLLALHPGVDFDVFSAAALAGVRTAEAEWLVNRLHDAHLLTQKIPGRYEFHDLLRVFALERMDSEISDDLQAVAVRRLFDAVLGKATRADELLAPLRYRPEAMFGSVPTESSPFDDEEAAQTWFRAEWPNLVALCRMAAEREAHRFCWQLAFMARSFFFLTKHWDAWIEMHTHALASTRALGEPWAQAMTANNLGVAMIDRGDLTAAAAHYKDALTLFQEIGDRHGISTALANYAWVSHYRGQHQVALQDMLVALDFYQESSAERNAAITLRGISLVEAELAEYADAVEHGERALGVFEELGLELDAAMALNCVGWARFRSGQYALAEVSYLEALARSERCGSSYESARAETGLGNVAAETGRSAKAREHWDRADDTHLGLHQVMVGEARARSLAELNQAS